MFSRLLPDLFIFPVGLSICLLGIGLILLYWRRARWGAALIAVGLVWMLTWSMSPVAEAMTRSLESSFADCPVESLPTADVIVVLGGVMRTGTADHPYPDLYAGADRVWHAARLYHAGKADRVLVSGGRPNGNLALPSDAEVMRDFLGDLGVPRSAVLMETESHSTRENAVYSAELMRSGGLRKTLLVTSALHMPRALAAFQRVGVDAVPAPTDFQVVDLPGQPKSWVPNAGALQGSTLALHEIVGRWWYWWRGWVW